MNDLPRKKLKTDTWFSAREARELIFYFIRWGDHSEHHLRNLRDSDVEDYLNRTGYNLSAAISELQSNPNRGIKLFENFLEGGTWEISASPGVQIKHSQLLDGVVVSERNVDEHAVFRISHKADFTSACQSRDRAIEHTSFDEFYTALGKGFSSLEGYMTLRAAVFNDKVDINERLTEKRKGGGFISFEQKMRDWLPRMTGVTIDFDSSAGWQDFKYLRQIRNDVAIHPKPEAGLATIEQLADGINKFRTGIAAIMFLLHQSFGETMQSSIIRAMKYPEVRVLRVTG